MQVHLLSPARAAGLKLRHTTDPGYFEKSGREAVHSPGHLLSKTITLQEVDVRIGSSGRIRYSVEG